MNSGCVFQSVFKTTSLNQTTYDRTMDLLLFVRPIPWYLNYMTYWHPIWWTLQYISITIFIRLIQIGNIGDDVMCTTLFKLSATAKDLLISWKSLKEVYSQQSLTTNSEDHWKMFNFFTHKICSYYNHYPDIGCKCINCDTWAILVNIYSTQLIKK